MNVRLRNALLAAAVVVTAAYLAWQSSSYWSGDYPVEAGPVIDSLIHGRLGDFLGGRALMGPLSLVLRAPFAAVSLITGGGGEVDQYDAAYRFGVFPCALFGGALGFTLFAIAERLGRSPLVKYGALILCTINPLTVKALTYGHPEEIVGGALLVAAMLAAIYERALMASILLAAAIATKQWAILGIPAVLIVLPWEKVRRPLVVLAALGLLVLIPTVAADPGSFVRAYSHLLDVRTGNTLPTSVWWPFTPAIGDPLGVVHHTPGLIGLGAHPLIIALSVALPLALRKQVSRDVLTRGLPLLALVLLIRCMFDPVDNSYYHLPFYLALIAADVIAGSLAPTLVAAGLFVLIIDLPTHPAAQAWIYIIWAFAFAVHLLGRACGREWPLQLRRRDARGRAVAVIGR